MADLLLGAAVILPNHRIQAMLGVGICKALTMILFRRKKKAQKQPMEIDDTDNDTDIADANTPVTVTWEDLTCTLTTSKGAPRRLLHALNGQAQPGRLLAILGASGSGKTTLLTALAGQVGYSSKLHLEGHISVNNMPQQQSRHRQAFVQQA